MYKFFNKVFLICVFMFTIIFVNANASTNRNFFEIGSEEFYTMIENGDLVKIREGAYLDKEGVIHIDVQVPSEHTGMTLQDIYGENSTTGTLTPTTDNEFYEIGGEKFYDEEFYTMIENGDLVKIREGAYLDKEGVIHIDVQVPSEHTGMTLQDIYGEDISRSTSMPTTVWNWSNGNYLNRPFSIQHMYVYTSFLFTGYSTLYTDTIASRNRPTPASGVYTVYLITGRNQGNIAASIQIDSTRRNRVIWRNLNPATPYAFAVGKANDGSILSGEISVIRG